MHVIEAFQSGLFLQHYSLNLVLQLSHASQTFQSVSWYKLILGKLATILNVLFDLFIQKLISYYFEI